ncbi:MAG: RNA polymerase sigma factor [Alphaproteobacteria bacterium]|nr:RNA polymerase sigma factor [Alphaproteobacteria bacterium]
MNDEDLLQAGYRYALSLRTRADDADDLVQEAWYRLHRHGGRAGSKAHLFTTIRNIYVDRWRRDQLIAFEPLETVDEPADSRSAIDDVRHDARALARLLDSLRAAEREALFLNVVEGYTAQEIGDLTGRPRGTVLSLIHRAKRKLRQGLAAGPVQPSLEAGKRKGSAS